MCKYQKFDLSRSILSINTTIHDFIRFDISCTDENDPKSVILKILKTQVWKWRHFKIKIFIKFLHFWWWNSPYPSKISSIFKQIFIQYYTKTQKIDIEVFRNFRGAWYRVSKIQNIKKYINFEGLICTILTLLHAETSKNRRFGT